MPQNLSLEFSTLTHEGAQQIAIMIVTAIQDELSGERHGRWYPAPSNMNYSKLTPKDQRAAAFKAAGMVNNYHIKYTGTTQREEILGGAYQASAPGEPPASRTGRLRQSFYAIISLTDKKVYKVKLTSNVYYASDLEFGTEKVDPRPFVSSAVSKILSQIIAIDISFHYRLLKEQ
jgi:hypothetical protein